MINIAKQIMEEILVLNQREITQCLIVFVAGFKEQRKVHCYLQRVLYKIAGIWYQQNHSLTKAQLDVVSGDELIDS